MFRFHMKLPNSKVHNVLFSGSPAGVSRQTDDHNNFNRSSERIRTRLKRNADLQPSAADIQHNNAKVRSFENPAASVTSHTSLHSPQVY
jgi:hypothetical protein